VKNCGALGSCLHKTEDGSWLAYSRWPDRATRDAAWPTDNCFKSALPAEVNQAILGLKDCLLPEPKFPEIAMEVIDDLLG